MPTPSAPVRGRRPGPGRWSGPRRPPTGRNRSAPPSRRPQVAYAVVRVFEVQQRRPRSGPSSRSTASLSATSRRTASWAGLVEFAINGDGRVRRHGATVAAAADCLEWWCGARPTFEFADQPADSGVGMSAPDHRADQGYSADQIAAYGASEQPAIAARMAPHLRMTYIGTGCCGAGRGRRRRRLGELSPFSDESGVGWAVTALVAAVAMLAVCVIQVVVWRRAMASWRGHPARGPARRGATVLGSPRQLVPGRRGRPAGLHGG